MINILTLIYSVNSNDNCSLLKHNGIKCLLTNARALEHDFQR